MTAIIAPDGLPATKETIVIRPDEMRVVANWARLARRYQWSFGCPKCHHDFVGKNAIEDSVWRVECGCREFVAAVTPGGTA